MGAGGAIFTSTIATSIEETLESVYMDKADTEVDAWKWCKQGRMKGAFRDRMQAAGVGLLHEKPEGQEIPLGSITEGYVTRVISRTFGRRIVITEEAMEDAEFDKLIDASRHLKRAGNKSVDISATLMLVRGFDTNYPGGDGLPLWSDSHTLPSGGTFSNVFATAMSPSVAAFTVGRAQTKKFPGYDGITEGVSIKRVLCPVEQESAWEVAINSEKDPASGNFSAVNVMARANIGLVPLKFWDNTTTNWCFQTDCEEDKGFQFLWRRRFKRTNWVENAYTQMNHALTARWGTTWDDPRCTLGSNA